MGTPGVRWASVEGGTSPVDARVPCQATPGSSPSFRWGEGEATDSALGSSAAIAKRLSGRVEGARGGRA